MKKVLCLAIAALLCAAMMLPISAAVPEAWFELGYKDGAPYDVKGNLGVEAQLGEVVETSVTHDGKSYPVTAFVGDADQEGILLKLPFESAEAYGEWLLGGCTFELFIELEGLTEGTSGFFTCVNGGGSSLYYRNGGDGLKQLQFQIGTTDATGADNTWGAYAGAAASDAKNGPCFLETEKLLHCVGTYDKETNTLNVYYNGALVSSGSYGNGTFNIGNAYYDTLGIGLNPAYPSESLGVGCEFRVVGAKLYKSALTAAEVAEEYQNSIAALTAPTVETEAPAAAESTAPETAAETVATVAQEAAPQTFDALAIFSVVSAIALAGYTASKKH